MNKLLFICAITGCCIGTARAQWEVKKSWLPDTHLGEIMKYAPHLVHVIPDKEWDASNFAPAEEVEKFRCAKYGMFIHFGLSSYKNAELSWGTAQRVIPDLLLANPPYSKEEWSSWMNYMKLENFNKEDLVKILRSSGMKYVMLVTKHHEGFHLWDTKQSEFKSTRTPWGKDLVKEISEACHEAGVAFGIYWSQRDWYRSDYAPVDPATVDAIPQPPFFKVKPGMTVHPGKRHAEYLKYQEAALHELCTQYGKIDLLWFDAAWFGGMFTADMWSAEELTRKIRKWQPGIVINNRASIPGDYDTPEQRIGVFQNYRPWETCAPLAGGWAYTGTPPKSPLHLIRLLQTTSINGGNLLLSWGMRWDGVWAPAEQKVLAQIGTWLKTVGEGIYGTWGGPWLPEEWGGTTFKDSTVYLHVTKPQTNKKITLRKLPGFSICSVKDLFGRAVSMTETKGEYVFDISKVVSQNRPIVIAMKTSRPITLADVQKTATHINQDKVLVKLELGTGAYAEINLPPNVLARTLALQSNAPLSGEIRLFSAKNGEKWEPVTTFHPNGKAIVKHLSRQDAGAILDGIRVDRLKIEFSEKQTANVSCIISGE